MKPLVVSLLVFLLFVPAAIAQQEAPALPQQEAAEPEKTRPPLSPRDELKLRADTYMARKLYPEAIEAYTELLKKEPKNALLLNMVGNAYLQVSDFRQAKKYYQRAIKADKTYSAPVNNLGVLHYQIRKYRQAARLYQKALELQPGNAAYHRNLGHAFFEQKKYDQAIGAFYQGLLLDPLLFERRGQGGSVLQHTISPEERPLQFFLLAKTFAMMGDAERCALYLRMARDEGYTGMSAVETDPAFGKVIADPLVLQVLYPERSMAAAPPGA